MKVSMISRRRVAAGAIAVSAISFAGLAVPALAQGTPGASLSFDPEMAPPSSQVTVSYNCGNDKQYKAIHIAPRSGDQSAFQEDVFVRDGKNEGTVTRTVKTGAQPEESAYELTCQNDRGQQTSAEARFNVDDPIEEPPVITDPATRPDLPGDPTANPNKPDGTKPDGTKPGKPGTKPGQPGTKPGQSGTKPGGQIPMKPSGGVNTGGGATA